MGAGPGGRSSHREGTAVRDLRPGPALEDVRARHDVRVLLGRADEYLAAIGYTEHGERHVSLVAARARAILEALGYDERETELAAIAGYMHDIGNVAGRDHHGQVAATLCFKILGEMGMGIDEIAVIMGAVGNHEEQYGQPVSPVSAAVVLADKSDVHRARVRNRDFARFDIHDRVNYAVSSSEVRVDDESELHVVLELVIDTKIVPVMEYFEIFLQRMIMCRRAAELLGCTFQLVINGTRLL